MKEKVNLSERIENAEDLIRLLGREKADQIFLDYIINIIGRENSESEDNESL